MTAPLASFALGVSASIALSLLVKATVLLVCGLALVRVMWTARASRRFVVLAWTFILLAALPVAVLFGPTLPVVVRETRHVVQTQLPPAPVVTARADAAQDFTTAATGSNQPGPASGASVTVVVAIVWAVGACLSLIPIVMTVIRLRGLRLTAREWSGDGRPRVDGVHLLVHKQLSAPITFGARRPVILFPADGETWSEADIQRALAHELEHVRRGDWPVHVLARVVCAFYWFHPLVWHAWRQLTLEADRACDDAVVCCSDAREFAEQLVALAGRVVPNVAAPALSIAGGDLATRVNALLNPNQARGRLGIGAAVAISVVAVTLGATVATVQAVDVTTFQHDSETSVRAQAAPSEQRPVIRERRQGETPAIEAGNVQQTGKPAPRPVVAAPVIAPAAPRQSPAATSATPPDYVIGPRDVLTIAYWREKEMSADYLVRPDGKISLPLLGDVEAAGLTPHQLRDRLTQASIKYFVDPMVVVGVKAINSRTVFIVGGVVKPGVYDLLSPMDVLSLIAVAGGLREFADGRNIVIIRNEEGIQRVFRFNYREVLTGENLGQNIFLKPGDRVMVAE